MSGRHAQHGGLLLKAVGFMLLMFLGLAWVSWSVSSHDITPKRVAEPTLADQGLTVLFSPGGQPGRAMRLDRLEVQSRSQLPFFIRAGLRGLAGERETALGPGYLKPTGFPVLELSWPSHYLPPGPVCDDAARNFADACPVFTARLLSWPLDDRAALLKGDGQLPSQQQVPYDQRVVTQWTAFHTRRDEATGQSRWDGWSCDAARLDKVNARIDSWGAQRDTWAVHPGEIATDCHQPPAGRLARWFGTGSQEHGVLWTCSGMRKEGTTLHGSCEAEFEHAGRRIVLAVPGGTVGLRDAYHPAVLRIRARLVKAAWLALEQAAVAAADAPAAPAEWQRRLARELEWCEALAAQSSLRVRNGVLSAAQAREHWRSEWRLDSVHHRDPCSSALHRILYLRDGAEPPAKLLADAQRLAAVEREQTGAVSEPLWTLVGEMLAAPGQPSLAWLQWQAQPPYLAGRAAELLAAHDALGAAVDTMPARERVLLRTGLAYALERGPDRARAAQLFFDAAREFGAAPELLPPMDGAYLLVWAAVTARQLPGPERSQRLQALLPLMERQAMALRVLAETSTEPLWPSIATLAVHAAWTAQSLAQEGGPDAGRWRDWLAQWSQWSATALAAQRPQVVRAVALHRDAARPGGRMEPDCPGGPLFACGIQVP